LHNLVTERITSAALLTAREHDAAGRHDDAVNTLAAATRGGDLQAMSELGHRLLIGDRAPHLVPHALSFITEAANRGEGRALARIAALTAAGAHMPQDWPKSLRLLGEAAEAGDESARGQIRSLQPTARSLTADSPTTDSFSADSRTADSPTADSRVDCQVDSQANSRLNWRALAACVPLDDWLRPVSSEPLQAKVHRVPSLVPPPVCAWLIARARDRLEPATVYDAVIKQDMVHEMRTNTAANFDYATLDVVQFLVQARMSLTCGYRIQHFEAPMILHYDVGQQITPHFDFIDANAPDYEQQIREQGQRMITFLLYLNDDYAGGETTFPKLGIVTRGAPGDGLYFINAHNDRTPDRTMLHTGSPPTTGEKWIVSQFIRDIPLRP
jgi:prolyl 4-hydroxylase